MPRPQVLISTCKLLLSVRKIWHRTSGRIKTLAAAATLEKYAINKNTVFLDNLNVSENFDVLA